MLDFFKFQFVFESFDLYGLECCKVVFVQAGLHVVRELEGRNEAFCKKHFFAGTRVACRSGFADLVGESAKAAKFNGMAVGELFADYAQELFDNSLDVCADEAGGLGYFEY